MIDTSKVIHAPVGGGRYTVTAPIVKEDYGLYLKIEGLELPSTYEVDFSNSEHNGTSVTMIGNSDGALIPSQFISSGKDIFAFLYHVGVDFGRTVYKFRIPNKCRPDRTNEQPTPTQQSVIDQAISALNSAVEQTAQDVIDADASAQSASADADRAEEAKTDTQNFATQAEQSATDASQSASQASASATASAQSAEASARCSADAQDSAEEAQSSASASAQSASASANSASQASGYAQSASASAQSASGYASQAQTSAQTASSKATEASGYASTASAKATESAQSASQALTYKNDAESAKTASQTAQGLAESARDLAQGYAEDAQGYAEDAQAYAEGISASASQIAQNTANILKAFPTDTASGAVASFADGADDIPLKSLIVNIDPVQSGTGDPSPDNIRPITGLTGCEVNANGSNLLNPLVYGKANISNYNKNAGTALSVSGGNTTASGENPILITNSTNWRGIIYIFTPKLGVTYRLSYRVTAPTKANIKRAAYLIDDSNVIISRLWQSGAVDSADTYVYRLSFTVTEAGQRFAFIIESSTKQTISLMDLRLEVGTDGQEWEPYAGETHDIDFGKTVYGGKLDVLSGILTVYPEYDSYNGETLTGRWISDRDVYAVGTTPTIGAQVVNIGAQGTEIQLEPHEVASLLGVNNIFADTGDTSTEYRADTRLYIEKLTQPTEDDMIADSAITSGQFFMIGNSLYRALANIASGATITVGTNAQRVSLSDALNLINA